MLNKSRQEVISLAGKTGQAGIFKKTISKSPGISVIAEIKQASPSKGVLRKDLNILDILSLYEKGGADAISVVTEEEFFLGKVKYLRQVRENTSLPLLRKDFIIDDIQIYHTKAIGADAVLLIVRLLPQEKLERLYKLSKDLGMDVVLEVHTHKELKRALRLSPDIIGINNRNLDTFEVDFKTTADLFPFINKGCLVISESGINSFKDILLLKGIGVDAVLIGEALMRSENIMDKMKELNVGAKD